MTSRLPRYLSTLAFGLLLAGPALASEEPHQKTGSAAVEAGDELLRELRSLLTGDGPRELDAAVGASRPMVFTVTPAQRGTTWPAATSEHVSKHARAHRVEFRGDPDRDDLGDDPLALIEQLEPEPGHSRFTFIAAHVDGSDGKRIGDWSRGETTMIRLERDKILDATPVPAGLADELRGSGAMVEGMVARMAPAAVHRDHATTVNDEWGRLVQALAAPDAERVSIYRVNQRIEALDPPSPRGARHGDSRLVKSRPEMSTHWEVHVSPTRGIGPTRVLVRNEKTIEHLQRTIRVRSSSGPHPRETH